MWNVVGVCVGALAVLASVSLHEFGHLLAAKLLGMTVTRYFVGFGPTVWSLRRRDTEYGVKALPLGGFVTIAGMNARDHDAEHPNAMWRFPLWRRTAVLVAGPAVHFIVAFLIFWGLAATLALPNPANRGSHVHADEVLSQPPFVSVTECLDTPTQPGQPCGQPAPAWQAGLRDGDRITRIADQPIATYGDLATAIRSVPSDQPVTVVYQRHGSTRSTTMTPISAPRPPVENPRAAPVPVPVVGLGLTYNPDLPRTVHHNVLDAAGVAASWVGIIFSRAGTAVATFPQQVVGLWHAVTGGHRDPQSPVSVVGVSHATGQLLATHSYPNALGVIAGMNIFLGLFNLLPLPPLDGGHIATAYLHRLRPRWLRPSTPTRRLLPSVALVLIVAFALFSLLNITADIVNPIDLTK
jgi:membrane-associated protease RseP (regulator of RpoE activity)